MPDVVVVGAGQAGLAMSRQLLATTVDHVVLERGDVGESWRRQRWDSFQLNTPGWCSMLPGDDVGATGPDGFATRDAFVAYMDDYVRRGRFPIRTGVAVTAVVPQPGARGFVVESERDDPITARAAVIATGIQRVPVIPNAAAGLPAEIRQLHSVDYRNPDRLPPGGVLVVGSGQSGCQIVEDLLDGGRTVHLATSRVPRLRRRYRGRDSFEWLRDAGYFAHVAAKLPDPAMQLWPQPLISGVGPYGHSISLQSLAARGVRLLGRVTGADRGRLTLADDVGANVAWGDARSADLNRQMDGIIAAQGVDAPTVEQDLGDTPHPDPSSLHSPETLDLDATGIGTVVWTTGVRGDFGWLPAGAVGADGRPKQTDGVAPIPGLFFIGMPWLRTRASGILPGVGPDAAYLGDRITEHLAG